MNTLAALVSVVNLALNVVIWVLVIQAILSWLVAFNVISFRNSGVRRFAYALERLTDPLLRPIRRVLPDMGGIDFSPMVLILLVILIQRLLDGIMADALTA